MKIEITNQQKIKRINLKQLKRYLQKAFQLLNISSYKITFVLCDNGFIVDLNKKYFKKAKATDVIAFPLRDKTDPSFLGEVVVSVQEAKVSAVREGLSFSDELRLYLIHGILHILGYTDRTKKERNHMQRKQQALIKILKSSKA